jgi:hypothetical protein
LIQALVKNPQIYKDPSKIEKIVITAYEPAFGIIGDPAKRNPTTRQSADHSMVYIVSTVLRKAIEMKTIPNSMDDAWCKLMLAPIDYGKLMSIDGYWVQLISLVEMVIWGSCLAQARTPFSIRLLAA